MPLTNISQLFPKPHPQTAGRVIDEEAVIILSEKSVVQVFNPVGSRIFELADGNHSVAQIIQIVLQEYDVSPDQGQADILNFLEELVKNEVLVV